MSRYKLFFIGAVAIVATITFYVSQKYSYPINTEVIFENPLGGDFIIPSTEGVLDTKSLRGKKVFIFFGFATCPSICPLTLDSLKKMVRRLPEQEQKNIKVLFISIDPKRDTLDIMTKKVHEYGEQFIGATGTQEKLRQITNQFGAHFSVIENKDAQPFVDHSDQIFIINSQGQWVETLNSTSSVDELLLAYKNADDKKPQYNQDNFKTSLDINAENITCDLRNETCSVKASNGEEFEVTMGPQPIRSKRNAFIVVKPKGSTLIPVAVDIKGLSLEMGYIRPNLNLREDLAYYGEMYLPTCAIADMKWKASIIVKDEKNKFSILNFYFTTTQNN